MSFLKMLEEYKFCKVILKDFTEAISNSKLNTQEILFRGDCAYECFLNVGEIYKLHNEVSSWTSDFNTAKSFSNKESMPEWYYNEDEWCKEEDFPFKGLDLKDIKTVIFRINKRGLRGVRVLDYIKDDVESEYVLAHQLFTILNIEEQEGFHLVDLMPID